MGRAKKKLEKKNSKNRITSPSVKNKKAFFEFEILEKKVAGVILKGTEVKSIRKSQIKLEESFVRIYKEVFLYGATIGKYEFGNRNNHDPKRVKKLLLNKREILKWKAEAQEKKLTIIPTRVFFKGSFVKLELGLAKRKLKYDKRKELKEKSIKRELNRELKKYA